jgi:CelD/BcsL family acetyltransferase involved in cellulose biosynthesis
LRDHATDMDPGTSKAVQFNFDFARGQSWPALDATAKRADICLDNIRLTLHRSLAAVEQAWRALETQADCTVFQSFDWLAAWQAHIGERNGVRPVIVVGRGSDGRICLLLPLAVQRLGPLRELTWLGSELCDYNAPVLATDFQASADAAAMTRFWDRVQRCVRAESDLQYDLVRLEKMPENVRGVPNPLCRLRVGRNASSAYLTSLGSDWMTFYNDKRSSATRRRDRTKRKRLAEAGEVRFVTPDAGADILCTLDTLMRQKARSLARMGVADPFARPGYADFYRALATGAATRNLAHVSRLDVGDCTAATNLGLVFGGCYYHLLASYDIGAASRFGPGAAHLHDLLRYAIERGLRVFDFTIGDERYKRDWCDTEIALYDHVAAASWRGILPAAALRAAGRVKRLIKQTPALWVAFCWIRAKLGAVRGLDQQ